MVKTMTRKINNDYINQYNIVTLTQPLSQGRYIKQTYEKTYDTRWKLTYTSNSAYHICPYDGMFRHCEECGASDDDFDIAYCLNKQQFISTGALNGRIHDCIRANLDVQFSD